MEPTRELIDDLYRERVHRARRTPMEQKFILGAELFEHACRLMADGIRNEFPEADEQGVREIMNRRLEMLRRLREPR
jgi:hypothetical protein